MMVLYKDPNGNIWCYAEYDKETEMHILLVVDEDEGYYTNTNITCYFTDEEFKTFTKI